MSSLAVSLIVNELDTSAWGLGTPKGGYGKRHSRRESFAEAGFENESTAKSTDARRAVGWHAPRKGSEKETRATVNAASGTSFVGRRENNEDTFRVCDDLGLYLVADGMGGHEGGEVASRLVADTITRFFTAAASQTNPSLRVDQFEGRTSSIEDALCDDDEPTRVTRPDGETRRAIRKRIDSAIQLAVTEVARAAKGELKEMGTTLAMLWVRDGVAIVTHVGDSRVYRLRGNIFEQLTHDHSFVAELERAGSTGLLASLPSAMRAMVTRCIALDANAEPDISVHATQPGDVFLLCSDGLTDAVSDEAIATILMSIEDPQEASYELNRFAFDAGSQDNITTIVVRKAS